MPNSEGMKKSFALMLGGLAYAIVVWYYAYAFEPVTSVWGRKLLWYACISCANVTGLQSSRLWPALLFIGPVNALLFGLAGYLVGVFLTKLRRNRIS